MKSFRSHPEMAITAIGRIMFFARPIWNDAQDAVRANQKGC